MFSIKDGSVSDNEIIYQLTSELYKFHFGENALPMLSAPGFLILQNDKFLQILLLLLDETNRHDAVNREIIPVGYTICFPEYDIFFAEHGILLDHFYIREAFRGKGQGRCLLKEICSRAKSQSAKYIKIYFKNGHNLDKFYSHFGFRNFTLLEPNIHLFEVYGHSELNRCFQININTVREVEDIHNNNIFDEFSNFSAKVFSNMPYILLSIPLPKSSDDNSSNLLPRGRVVVLMQIKAVSKAASAQQYLTDTFSLETFPANNAALKVWKKVKQLSNSLITKNNEVTLCAFQEKPTVCSWLGKMITFCNFVGDVRLISSEILNDRVDNWALEWPTLMGVNFEIPFNECTPTQSTNIALNPLISLLDSLGISDSSESNGWNFAALDEEKIDQVLAR